ncbi:MAG: PaaI family thioesterase [Acidimicrobiia bacterium]|nr:MAG: PaaI family thioesterase [Acidimicrobiia bacterium]
MTDPQPPVPDLRYGLNGALDFEFLEVGPDRVEVRIAVDVVHQQPYGIVHGGVYCTLIEAAASTGGAFWAMSQGMPGAVGVSNTTDFLRSVRGGELVAEATPLHRGRTQQLWQVVVTRSEDGKVAARGQVRLQNLTDTSVVGGLEPV